MKMKNMTEKPKITKLVVGRGSTRKIAGTENFDKVYYQIEFEFAERPRANEFEQARKVGFETITAWLNEAIAKPSLSVEEIDKLPWKHYQTKDIVGPGHIGWILWDRDGGADLAKAIEQEPEKKLKLDPYEFSFSGKERQFISRKVIEPTEPASEAPS